MEADPHTSVFATVAQLKMINTTSTDPVEQPQESEDRVVSEIERLPSCFELRNFIFHMFP